MVEDYLPDQYKSASEELSVYLLESVGNETRIDYGTGRNCTFFFYLNQGMYSVVNLAKIDRSLHFKLRKRLAGCASRTEDQFGRTDPRPLFILL